MTKLVTYALFVSLTVFGCKKNQHNPDAITAKKLISTYNEFERIRSNYEHNDSLIIAFENHLIDVLTSSNDYLSHLDSLAQHNRISLITSKDKKLSVLTWDLINNGCNHLYNSVYVFDGATKEVGFLDTNFNTTNYLGNKLEHFAPFKIFKLNEDYLVKSLKEECMSSKLYSFRLFNSNEGHLSESKNAFNKEKRFIYLSNKSDTIVPIFDEKNKLIKSPLRQDIIFEGELTGFSKPTGAYETLSYKDGKFIP
jgi:hypothetical protein